MPPSPSPCEIDRHFSSPHHPHFLLREVGETCSSNVMTQLKALWGLWTGGDGRGVVFKSHPETTVPEEINNLGEKEIFLTGWSVWLPRLPGERERARAEGDCHMSSLILQDAALKPECGGACSVFQSLLNISSFLKGSEPVCEMQRQGGQGHRLWPQATGTVGFSVRVCRWGQSLSFWW